MTNPTTTRDAILTLESAVEYLQIHRMIARGYIFGAITDSISELFNLIHELENDLLPADRHARLQDISNKLGAK